VKRESDLNTSICFLHKRNFPKRHNVANNRYSYVHDQTDQLLCLLYVSERTTGRTYAAELDYGTFMDRITESANSVLQSWNNYRY
jgi:hypothetical protein